MPGDELSNRLSELPDTIKNTSQALLPMHLLSRDGTRPVQLSFEQFQKWYNDSLDALLKQEEENPEAVSLLATVLLSRDSILSANELWAFLQSPAGQTLIDAAEDRLAELESIQEYQEEEWREEQRQEDSFKMFLLMLLAFIKETKAETLNDYLVEQINKLLNHAEGKEELSFSTGNDMVDYLANKSEALRNYDDYLNSLLGKNTEEMDAIEKQKMDLANTFATSTGLTIQKDENGNYYLVPQGKELNDLDANEKLSAKEKFHEALSNSNTETTTLKPELRTAVANAHTRDAMLTRRMDFLGNEKNLIDNQKLQVQAALATVQNYLNPEMPVQGLPNVQGRSLSINREPVPAPAPAPAPAVGNMNTAQPGAISSRLQLWIEQQRLENINETVITSMNDLRAEQEKLNTAPTPVSTTASPIK